MTRQSKRLYNPYFLIPFLLWAILGFILVWNTDKIEVFRYVNSHYSKTWDSLMYFFTWIGAAEVIIPTLVLPLLIFKKFRSWWYFSLATACNLVPFIVVQILKSAFDHPRPLHYVGKEPWLHHLPHWDFLYERSFPSGHSEGAFSFFCFLALVLPQKHRYWGVALFVLALFVGYSRIYLTAHFLEDVYAGSLVGAGSVIVVYYVMNQYIRKYFKNTNLEAL